MKRPKICAVITDNDFEMAAGAARFADLYEVRIDLIGDGWQEWVKRLRKPWIASNRLKEEDGLRSGDDVSRIGKLFEAIGLARPYCRHGTEDAGFAASNLRNKKRESRMPHFDLRLKIDA